jgi:hypothetical protein
MPIQAINAGTQIASTIAGFADARKRTQFEQQLALLDYDQKKKLNDELIKANSEDARQMILASSLGNISGKRVDSLAALAIEKEKTNKVVTIIGIGAGILLFGGIVFVLLNDKKN